MPRCATDVQAGLKRLKTPRDFRHSGRSNATTKNVVCRLFTLSDSQRDQTPVRRYLAPMFTRSPRRYAPRDDIFLCHCEAFRPKQSHK